MKDFGSLFSGFRLAWREGLKVFSLPVEGSRSLMDHLKIYSGKYIFNKNLFYLKNKEF